MHYLRLLAPGALPMEKAIDIRFSDLDPYQHVNSSRYLDLLNSAVWQWAQDQGQVADAVTKAPRIARLEIDFRRPIHHSVLKFRLPMEPRLFLQGRWY